MPGKVIGKTMNIGYPGSFSRNADCIIAARCVKTDDEMPINFGDPVVLNDDDTYSRFGEAHTADDFIGIAIREVKQSTDYFSPAGSYFPGQACDALMRGAVCVVVHNGTPKAGGKVYIRIKANAAYPNGVIGGIEAAADGANTIELANVRFTTGNMDGNNVAEITILTRNA